MLRSLCAAALAAALIFAISGAAIAGQGASVLKGSLPGGWCGTRVPPRFPAPPVPPILRTTSGSPILFDSGLRQFDDFCGTRWPMKFPLPSPMPPLHEQSLEFQTLPRLKDQRHFA